MAEARVDGSIPANEAAGHPVGVDEKPDFGATTAVNLVWEKLKGKVTPRIAWAIGVALVVGTGTGVAYVMNARHKLTHVEETVTALQQQVKDAAATAAADRELLHKIDNQNADISRHLEDKAAEVDRLSAWRDHVEGVASLPPHAATRRRH